MQIAQELNMHAMDGRNSVRSFIQARPPKRLVVILVCAAFILGWSGGFNRGLVDGTESGEYMHAFLISMAAKELDGGNVFLVEKFHAQSVDRLVRSHVAELNASFSAKAWQMTSPTYWLMRGHEQRTHDIVVSLAERRLRIVPSLRAETIDEAVRLGLNGTTTAYYAGSFSNAAKDYSTLLGREIRDEQLVPDAYLRQTIQAVKQAAADKR